MISIFRKIIVLFSMIFQTLGRIGITRDEKQNIRDKLENLEDSVDDEEAGVIERKKR